MDHTIEDVNLGRKLEEMSLDLPKELAFFPENLETATSKDQFIFTESMVDLGKRFKKNNVNSVVLGGDTELYRSRKNADIFLPAIFFSLSVISENSTVVSISLNVLSNYITDLLKGTFGRKVAQIDFYIETKEKGKVKRISYKGTPEGLKDLEKIIKATK